MFVKPNKLIRLFYPSILWKKKAKKTIWLTFDDGPEDEVTEWILSVLKSENIKATFFLIGNQIEKFPNLFNDIIKQGHIIGNHSYSHLNGWKTENSKYLEDVECCQKLMPENRLFRPPFGKLSITQIKKLKKKYKIILWDILTLDFKDITGEKIKDNVLNNVEGGSIIVFHNNRKSLHNIKPILKDVIIELKKKGFKFSNSW